MMFNKPLDPTRGGVIERRVFGRVQRIISMAAIGRE